MSKPTVSRRTLAKGAAWSVPAVAVATAAPHISASPIVPPCLTFEYTANACRRSNEAVYKFGFCITNNCKDRTLNVEVTRIINGAGKVLNGEPNPFPIADKELAPGEQLCVTERVWRAASQANSIDVYGRINGGDEMILFNDVDAPQKTDACATGTSTTTTTKK